MRRLALCAALASCILLSAPAEAFSTRVHIAIANDLRESMIAASDGTIPLRLSNGRVTLKAEDVRALKLYPLAFRGGMVGPDNMAFPAMTDPSHALYQKPFMQCEMLYQSAANDEERAYALGCFAHGALDIVAHHYVNYFTGETFTVTPLEASRTASYSNVVRHVMAEALVQDALLKLRPAAFTQNQLSHSIPTAFVARNYFLRTSGVYPFFAGPQLERIKAAKAAAPTQSLLTVVETADLATGDHLALVPVYLDEVDGLRSDARAKISKTITDLQNQGTVDGAKLKATPGPDGKLGTRDDGTSCSVTCASIYAKYFVSIGLLSPRKDAGGGALPSAFDKISDKLGTDLRNFVPAYLSSVERISNRVNTPLQPGQDGLDFAASDLPGLFQPLTAWSDELTTIDYRTLSNAVVPGWIIDIENALQSVGVTISVPGIMTELLRPVIDPLKNLLKEKVIDTAKGYLEELVSEYTSLAPAAKKEFQGKLELSKDPALSGSILDHLLDSGLYAHSFNLAATAMAAHEAVLPDVQDTSSVQLSPVSFDTSYGPDWAQAGACEYLRKDVFPFGLGVRGLLSVVDKSEVRMARTVDESPVECHDGSLKAFSEAPTAELCSLTNVPALRKSKQGSVSGGFPPALGSTMFSCRGIVVPGLTLPPASKGSTSGSKPGSGPSGDVESGGGCGCRAGAGKNESESAFATWLALCVLSAMSWRLRRSGSKP